MGLNTLGGGSRLAFFDQPQCRSRIRGELPAVHLALPESILDPDAVNQEVRNHRPFPGWTWFKFFHARLEMVEEGSEIGFFIRKYSVSDVLDSFRDHVKIIPFESRYAFMFPCIFVYC